MHAAHKTGSLLGRLLPGFLGLAALGLIAPSVHAQTAYVDSFGSDVDTFGTISLQTGAFTSIGALNNQLYALGFGSNGTLYGLGPSGSGGTDLYQVATGTGQETFLQTFAGYDVYGGSGNADGTFTAITNGTAANRDHSSLFTLNPVTQTATAGPMTFAEADGLAVADGSGHVYVSDTNVTASGQDGLDYVDTTAKHPSTAYLGDTGINNVYTGLFAGGKLFTFGYVPALFSAGPEGVYTLDTNTGASTLVAETSNNQDIIAAALAPAVPEASTTVSFGLLLVLGLGSVMFAAKKRKAAAVV